MSVFFIPGNNKNIKNNIYKNFRIILLQFLLLKYNNIKKVINYPKIKLKIKITVKLTYL